jgi:predicted acylesterase/phospholipase RssA
LLGILDSARMRAVVERYASIGDLRSALLVAATNLTSAEGTVFAHFPANYPDADRAKAMLDCRDVEKISAETYVDAICASAAIPAAFDPVSIVCKDGRTHAFVDGAFTNNTPLQPAIDAGASEIVVISLSPVVSASAERSVRHLRDVVTLALEASTARMLQLDRKVLELINDRVAAGDGSSGRHIVVREVCPSGDLACDPLDFADPEKIAGLLAQGRVDGERAFAEDFALGR